MKSIRFNTAALLLLIFGCIPSVDAQKSITEIAEMSDKKWDKFARSEIIGDYWLEGLIGTGLLNPENVPEPKRIGIVTLQMYSISTYSTQKAGGWIYTRSFSPTAEGEAFLVDQMMGIIVPVMKETFKKEGYEILEPEEFADTPEKSEAYKNGRDSIEATGFTKLIGGKIESGADEDFSGLVPEGYVFYPISPDNLGMDSKGPAGYGKLAERLGLDAVMILSMMATTSKKYVTLNHFRAAIVCPVQDNKEAEYTGRINSKSMNYARDGIVCSYAGIETDDIPLLKIKREEFVEYYYEDFDKVVGKMAGSLIHNLEELKAWEPKGKKK